MERSGIRDFGLSVMVLELDTEKSGVGAEVHREELFSFLRGVGLGLK